MSLKFGKKQVATIAEVIDQEWGSVEECAAACLEAMESVFEERSKFVVVGQVVETKDEGVIASDHPNAVKLSLGWYSTEGDARSAADSFMYSTRSGDRLHVWVLPVFHGSPADWHGTRKDKQVAASLKAKEEQVGRLAESIEKHQRKGAQAMWDWLSDEEKAANPHLHPDVIQFTKEEEK